MPAETTPPPPPMPPPPGAYRPLPASAWDSHVTPPQGMDTLFGRFWPDVDGGHRGLVAAALGVGILAGLILPHHSYGLAIFLVAAAAGGTVAYAAKHRRQPFTVVCLVLAALSTLPVILLDANWVGVLCLLAGATALIAGVTRPRRFLAFVLAGISWPLAGLRDLPWLGRTLRSATGHERAPRVLVTVVVSVLGVLIFGLLFVSADAVVESWVDDVLPDLSLDSAVFRIFVAIAVAGSTLAAAYLALNPPAVEVWGVPARRTPAHRWEWLVPVLLVDAVFGLFVAAQLSVLFGSHGYVQRTTGLTYAEYVHQGFGQLTVATLLTLLVVWAAAHWADEADRRWLRGSLGVLCAFTMVVVVSALHRMSLYQDAYGLTRLRLVVYVFEGWLGLLVVGAAVAGLVRWGVWVPRFALVTGVAALLGLAALNPDALIADQNLDRYDATGRVDWHYLRNLSADAVPAFKGRDAAELACGLPRYWSQTDDWLAWNLGRSRASSLTEGSTEMSTALTTTSRELLDPCEQSTD